MASQAISFFPEVSVPDGFAPFDAFRQVFGFVPNLFRAQTLLPRAIEVEARVAGSVLLTEVALSRKQKEFILLALAAAHRNTYCVANHARFLHELGATADQIDRIIVGRHAEVLSEIDSALVEFALDLGLHPTVINSSSFDRLRAKRLTDEQILEAVLTTALTNFLCTLSVGLGVRPDFEAVAIHRDAEPRSENAAGAYGFHHQAWQGPYLRFTELAPESFPPFAFFRDRFGFVPNIFRAQTLRPDVVESEAHTVGAILLSDDVLSRIQKEYILLAVSAANLNTYCVAVHCEMLRALGVSEDDSDQIAVDHRLAGLSKADSALLDFALTLSQRPAQYKADDIDGLRRHGWTDPQILESVVMTSLTDFLNTLQMGLGPVSDVTPRRVFEPSNIVNPGTATATPMSSRVDDEDARLVARVQAGETSAFEALVHRHGQRIYRTLVGVTGSVQEAEDGAQTAFLKAFTHIRQFRGDASFSTWLTRIAINEGIQSVRKQKLHETLDAHDGENDEGFRPRNIQEWAPNAEQLYSSTESRAIVERALLQLPPKYRVPVMLRDVEQLSGEEAAAVLGVAVPTMKTRLMRGRLMLRERLAPYFAQKRGGHPA